MSYPSYLVHFNQNHSAKNGQFISGDGDGDGITNDHKNQKKKLHFGWRYKTDTKEGAQKAKSAGIKQIGAGAITTAVGAGTLFVGKYLNKTTDSVAGDVVEAVGSFVTGFGIGSIAGGTINTARGASALKKYN